MSILGTIGEKIQNISTSDVVGAVGKIGRIQAEAVAAVVGVVQDTVEIVSPSSREADSSFMLPLFEARAPVGSAGHFFSESYLGYYNWGEAGYVVDSSRPMTVEDVVGFRTTPFGHVQLELGVRKLHCSGEACPQGSSATSLGDPYIGFSIAFD